MRRRHFGVLLVALVAGLAVVAGPIRVASQPIQASASGSHTHGDGTLCVLRLIPENMHTRVAPPEAFLRGVLPGGPGDRVAAITVNYTGFSAQAQTAFQYAVGIWQAQLTSAGPIVVNAQFADLGAGILGSAGAAWSFRDFSGATRSGTWYAKALANKLFGGDVNASYTPEINASFSSTYTWYYGTDGNTPAGQVDFVSVVLHELCHGLGFSGAGRVTSGLGYVRASGYPLIYDHFVENGSAQALLTSFTEGSAALAAQLTGNSLYWNGTSGVSGGGGSKPRLYAPGTWSQGSSYSHLNESTYPAGNANSLMTYAIGYAEAIHDPGPITRGLFTDMGWTTNAPSPPPAPAAPFTDDPLVAGSTVVKAVHITELRVRIDALRATYGLGAYSWTDATLTSGSSTVRAVHITDMRTALAQAYAAASRTAPTYTDPTLTATSNVVKAVHITELRAAVIALE